MKNNAKNILFYTLVTVAVLGVLTSISTVAIDMNGRRSLSNNVIAPESPPVLTGSADGVFKLDPVAFSVVTPDKVSGLSASEVGTGSAKVSWKPSEDATEYWLYRADEGENGKIGEPERIAVLRDTEFEDKGLNQATLYNYQVYAYRKYEGAITHSTAAHLSVITAPEAVKNAEVKKISSDAVKMSWDKNERANAYRIYRSIEKKNGKFGGFKLRGKLKKKANVFVDRGLTSGKAYRYMICTLRTRAKLSAEGSGSTVEAVTKLKAVESLSVTSGGNNSAKITWKKLKMADGYMLYRDGKLLKELKKTEYTDKKLKKDKRYAYTVKAVREYDGQTYIGSGAVYTISTADRIHAVPNGLKGTWIEVSISSQTARMYVKDKLYLTTPVVTGTPIPDRTTARGFQTVRSKLSPATLKGEYRGSKWEIKTHYWLGFNALGQGLHDSTWRGGYGGSIYTYDGSHGCVNTPLEAMGKMYEKAYIGMPVIVY